VSDIDSEQDVALCKFIVLRQKIYDSFNNQQDSYSSEDCYDKNKRIKINSENLEITKFSNFLVFYFYLIKIDGRSRKYLR